MHPAVKVCLKYYKKLPRQWGVLTSLTALQYATDVIGCTDQQSQQSSCLNCIHRVDQKTAHGFLCNNFYKFTTTGKFLTRPCESLWHWHQREMHQTNVHDSSVRWPHRTVTLNLLGWAALARTADILNRSRAKSR